MTPRPAWAPLKSRLPHGKRLSYDLMMTELSDDSADKLQAALNYAAPDPDDYLSVEYRDACAAWFARLTQGERGG